MNKDENYLKKELYELLKSDDYFFDFIQEGSLDGIWYWDLEKPENEWMSPKFWTALGYNPDEMPHSPEAWKKIINQDDLNQTIEKINAILKNPDINFDQVLRYTHKNGSIVWIRCRGMVIRDNNGKPLRMVGVHQDITLQKKAEEDILSKIKIFESLNHYAIEISELPYNDLFTFIAKRIKELFEINEVVINLFDEKNSEIVTKYTTFSDNDNTKISKYLGGKLIGLRTPLSKDGYDIITSNIVSKVDSLHKITLGQIPDAIGKVIENIYGLGWFVGIALMQNNKLVGTIVLVGKKGKEVPDPTVLETFIKITSTELSRKIAEQSLIDSELRYRSLLTNLETGVVVHNKDTSIILSNARASELLGLSENQMRGKAAIDPHWKFIYEDNSLIPLNDYPVMRILNSKKAIRNQILGVYRKPDDVVWLMVNGFPSFYNDEVSEIIISFNDITDVRKANQELSKAKQEVEESEQRFKALHNASFGGITIHDKGVILDCNQGLSDMFDYSLSELIGMNGLLLIAPQDRDFVMNKITTGFEKPYEAYGIKKNGEIFPMRLEARNIPYKGKQVRTVEFRDLTEQKKAEESLRKSKAIKEAMVSNIGDVIVIIDEHGINKYKSPNVKKLFGWDPEELIGNSAFDLVHPDSLESVQTIFNKILNEPNSTGTIEFQYKRKDGEYVWTEIKLANLLHNNDIHGILGNYHDISQRKLVEEKIRQKDLEFRKLSQNLPDLIFQFTRRPDGSYCVPIASEGIKNIFGCTPEEVVDDFTPIAKVIHPDDAERVIKDIEYSAEHLTFFTCEFRVQIPGKPVQWIFSRSTPEKLSDGSITWFGFNANITDKKEAENALLHAKEKAEENEQMFKSLIENAPDGVVIVDIDGKLKYASPNSARQFGYDENEYIGRSGAEFTHPDDIPLVMKTFEVLMIEPTLKPKIIYRFKRKDGQYRWIETTFTNQLSNKYINGFILNFNDITERKKAEEALRSSEAKLNALFSSLSEMVVLHELVFDSVGHPINYRITDCNDAFTKTTGILKETAVGKLSTDIYGTDFPPYLEVYSAVALTGIPHHYETYFKPMDKYFLISVVSPERNHFATVTTDITELKRAEMLIQDKSEEIAVQNEELNIANQELIATISRAEQNEANVTAIIEGTQNSIWAFDKNYNILYINQVFKNEFFKTFGVKLDIGSNLINCLPEVLRPFWKPRYDRVLAKEQYTVEDAVETEFGTVYIQGTFNPIIKNGEVIGGSCFGSNITERKKAEKEIIIAKERAEESEMQFRNLFENASDAIFIAEEERGIIIDVNHSAEKLMLMNKNEIIGMHQSQLHPPELDEFSKLSFLQHRRKSVGDKSSMFFENFVVRSDGSKIPVEILANELIYKGKHCLVGTFRDISERRNAEIEILKAKEKIEQSEENLRFLFDNMIQGVVYHKPSGEIIRANEAASRILGLTIDQLFGRSSFDPRWKAIHEDKSEYLAEDHPVMSTIKTKKPVINEIMGVFIPESNKYSWININSIPKFDEDGELIQVVVTFEDITEIRNAKEKAEESDRLKSAFLANMSHEIRTPMNGILGFSQLLKEPDLSGDEQLEFISIIEKSGKRMLNIINDIIDISKIEAGLMDINLSQSNINEQIEYIYSFFKPEANAKNLNLTCSKPLPSDFVTIQTDREKLFAILTNLVKNAIKYTNQGYIDFGYRLKLENNIKFLQFYVKDTGIGIPKSRHEAIFERFIQADLVDVKAYQGAGLGLAITKAYIEMLGGKIWVDSEVGKGSTFYFNLPLNIDNKEGNSSMETKKVDNRKYISGLKILIAEDDKISEKLIEKYLQLGKNEILNANTGAEAIELCRNHPDIDIILMDIQMPEINGYEATRQIREFNKDVIIIAQTAYGLTGDKEKALDAGCNDYLAKPINKEELFKLINKYKGS